MKNKRVIISVLLIILTSTLFFSCRKQFQPVSGLSELVEQDKYSDLYSELTDNRKNYSKKSLMLYDIILQSVMNKPEESNRLINKFRRKFSVSDHTTNYYLTHSEYNNYLKLCNYNKLKEIGDHLIANYKSFIDSSEYVELRDDNIRYTYLKDEKPVILFRQADTKMKIIKDLAGYTLMSVKGSNDSTVNMIFDTGANVNVVTQTSAAKMNLREIPGSKIYVMGATGVRNEAQIGIADRITIGNMGIRNAEFLILADSLLSFAGGLYKILGIVGFPIFSRFEEITYTDSTIFIPETPVLSAGEPNMFVKSDDYILSISYNGKKYPFFFDTGNSNTHFQKNFYLVDSLSFRSLKDTAFIFGGVGGQKQVRAKQPDEVTLQFSGKSFRLVKPFIALDYEPLHKSMYGSIGKDFVELYGTRTISFKESRMTFE